MFWWCNTNSRNQSGTSLSLLVLRFIQIRKKVHKQIKSGALLVEHNYYQSQFSILACLSERLKFLLWPWLLMSVYSPSVYTPQLDKKNGDRLRFNYYARFEVASGISGSRSLRYSLFFTRSGSHIVAQSKIKFHKRRKNVPLLCSNIELSVW